jgi:apolipoprotein N-acyltransferase
MKLVERLSRTMNKLLTKITPNLPAFLVSGLLLGLSWPSYPYVRLEVFAWVWMVPMLLALKSVKSFWRFLLNVLLALFVFSVFGMFWLITSSTMGTLLLFFVGTFVYAVPFVAFFFLRQTLGWRRALWLLPVVWTGWDWIYHLSEGSFGWLAMGVTQSNLYWLVQYVDITGVWGITFWLVLFNVLVVMAIEQFPVFSFQFPETSREQMKNENRKLKAGLTHRLAFVTAVMLLPPLGYSAFIFGRASRAPKEREISVFMIQPNVDPWQKFDKKRGAAIVGKTAAQTESALTSQKPDLIIWPESAVPYFFLEDKAVQEFLKRAVARWDVPLLTGVLDRHVYNNSHQPPGFLDKKQDKVELFNAALILSPELPKVDPWPTVDSAGLELKAIDNDARTKQWLNVKTSELYHKRILMPFVERVPYVDRFPGLARLALNVGGSGGFTPGNEATVFSFKDRQGENVILGTAICYDQEYPATMAESVRNGAQMLAVITNEGYWSQTQGAYEMAAFTRLRAIEMRRSIARAANTGVTSFIDPLGRVYQQAPWWSEQTVSGKVSLSEELTVYVRYTDYFPKVCLWLLFALGVVALLRRARQVLWWRQPRLGAVR